jgi:hypothetical protein
MIGFRRERVAPADSADLAQVELGAGGLDMVVRQPPEPGVVLADLVGDGLDRHLGQQRHEQCLKTAA